MIHIIKSCTEKYEKNPSDQYLRVMVFSLYLMDKELTSGPILQYSKKQVKLSKVSKMFKEHPRIKLYKELPFNVENFVKNCPNFNDNSVEASCKIYLKIIFLILVLGCDIL